MKSDAGFRRLLVKYKGDPRFIAEGLLIDMNEQVVRVMERKGVNASHFHEAVEAAEQISMNAGWR